MGQARNDNLDQKSEQETEILEKIYQLAIAQDEKELNELLTKFPSREDFDAREGVYTTCCRLAKENNRAAVHFLLSKFKANSHAAIYEAALGGHLTLVNDLIASLKPERIDGGHNNPLYMPEWARLLYNAVRGAIGGNHEKIILRILTFLENNQIRQDFIHRFQSSYDFLHRVTVQLKIVNDQIQIVSKPKPKLSNIAALVPQADKIQQTMETKQYDFTQALAWDLPEIQGLFLYHGFLNSLDQYRNQKETVSIEGIFLIIANYLAPQDLNNNDLSRILKQVTQFEYKQYEEIRYLKVRYQCSGLFGFFNKDKTLLDKIHACEQAQSIEELDAVLKPNKKNSIQIEEVKDEIKTSKRP